MRRDPSEDVVDLLAWCYCVCGDAFMSVTRVTPPPPPQQQQQGPSQQITSKPKQGAQKLIQSKLECDLPGDSNRSGGSTTGFKSPVAIYDLAAALICFQAAVTLCPSSSKYADRVRCVATIAAAHPSSELGTVRVPGAAAAATAHEAIVATSCLIRPLRVLCAM